MDGKTGLIFRRLVVNVCVIICKKELFKNYAHKIAPEKRGS